MSQWLTILILAVAIGLVLVIQEVPIDNNSRSSTNFSPLEAYNIVDVEAPAFAGPVLQIFRYIATKTPIRPFLIRSLLNTNGIHKVRQLAADIGKGFPPTYYPISRLSVDQHDYHIQKASELNGILLKEGVNKFSKASSKNNGMYRSISDYHGLYRSQKATPSQVMTKFVEGCEKLEHLHIFASFDSEDIQKQAAESDKRWKDGAPLSLLDGVPVAIKDLARVKGHKTCHGMLNCQHPPLEDEPEDMMVSRFRNAGAIIVGMTVSTEVGVTPLGYSLWFDGPYNPYDTNYYPGGSSAGSAVIVASGLAPLAIGFDGGGSIRIPAAMSGIYGLASTFGRIETEVGNDYTVVKGGPMTGTVQDMALTHVFLNDNINPDHYYSKLYDGGQRGVPPAHLDGYAAGVKGMRLGIYWDHFQHSDPEVVAKCQKAVNFLVESGAEIVNITIPYLHEIQLAHGIKILSEFATFMDGAFYDPAITLEANTDITLLLGKELTAVEVLAGEVIRTWAIDLLRNKIYRDLMIDAIVSPMMGTKVPKPKSGYRQTGESNTPLVHKVMRFTPLANFLGLPAISLPIGYENDTGLPIGFQLLGDAWTEHKLLRIAAVLEDRFINRQRPPLGNFYDPLSSWL